MTLIVQDTLITSDISDHQAAVLPLAEAWTCTWMAERRLTKDEAVAAMELVEIVSRGRDGGPDTTNYAYLTWRRVMELAEVLGVVPLKTVLYLESLEPGAEGPERSDPSGNPHG